MIGSPAHSFWAMAMKSSLTMRTSARSVAMSMVSSSPANAV
jgi:hypothetical protein